MAVWRETTLGEVCDEVNGIIQTGPFGSQLHESDYSPEGIPVVMPKDIIEGRIATDSVARVSPEHVERLSRHKLRKGDIVYGRRGDIGRQALIRPEQEGWMCGTGCLRLSFGESVLDPLFLHYYLRQDDVVRWITNQAVGATMPNLNTGILRTVPVRFPPLRVQRRIAGILSAYDELMENSQRRIRLLEAMARSLYREWFVHFRFPGHEKFPRVASPLGDIPQDWEVKPLFDLTKVNYGKNLPTKKLAGDGAYPVYGAAKIIGRYTEYTRKRRTIICGCRGSVGEMQITEPQCFVTNNSFTFDPAHSDNFFWLFHTLKERGLRDVVGGAAQPQITLEGISSVELVTPPLPIRSRFQRTVAAMFEQAWALDNQIQNLRRTRDLLLPRLLSGQLQLSQADETAKKIIPLWVEPATKAAKKTTDEFVEAVLIAQLTRKLASPQFPLGRLRYNKLGYFAHRKAEDDVTELYLKKAAGPYSPWAKYQGPEKIALKNGYVKRVKAGVLEGLAVGESIDKIDRYLAHYPVCATIDWVVTMFRYRRNDDLELLATVDFAAIDLLRGGAAVALATIKHIIATNKEWSPKLNRAIFSDENITRALTELRGLFPNTYAP